MWDYPRPPRLESFSGHIKIEFNGQLIADTRRAYRVLETSHPPVYYLPPADIAMHFLTRSSHKIFCEWKGVGYYYDISVGSGQSADAAWYYPNPTEDFKDFAGYVAFYAHRVDKITVDGEKVVPQPGNFYGGWITSNIVGPFKGGPGTTGW